MAFSTLVPSRLNLNHETTDNWNVMEAAEGCVRPGIPWIGLWRDKVAKTGLALGALAAAFSQR